MILIGQFDSSFVRRVGIALRLYEMPFEHRPWSVFSDAARLRALSPPGRVPVLVLDDGEVLSDGAAILDNLDEAAGDRALVPRAGAARRDALRVTAWAMSLAERGMSLFYARHMGSSGTALTARLEAHVAATLSALEADRAGRAGPWWQGAALGHADVAVACALRHVGEAMPDQWDPSAHPALAEHAAACEALHVFRELSQPFRGP